MNTLPDAMIPLEKLLQVLMAFMKDGYFAFTKKDSVLKRNSEIYKDFCTQIGKYFIIDNMIKLYFVFYKAEIEKKESGDKRTPIPYYVLGYLGKTVSDKNIKSINDTLSNIFKTKEDFLEVYDFCKTLSTFYRKEYFDKYKLDYNIMIKRDIDYEVINKMKDMVLLLKNGSKLKLLFGNQFTV